MKLWMKWVGILLFLLVLWGVYHFYISPQTKVEEVIPPKPQKISFLVFGDSGTGSRGQKELAKTMLNFPFNFILHTGDIAYPDGTEQQLEDNFFTIYKEHRFRATVYPGRDKLVYPAPGNHDYITDNLTPYLSAFDVNRYYSVDFDNVHIVSLDTNSPLNEISENNPSDMANWLEEDLVNNRDKKWKIVFFHHPPYSSGKEHGGDVRVQEILVPIFEKHGVDIVFSGHEHNYERTCQLTNGECVSNGITYIVTGGGGGPIYDFGPEEYFTASRSAQHHFVQSIVDGCKFIAEVINIKQEVIDQFSLDKCNR